MKLKQSIFLLLLASLGFVLNAHSQNSKVPDLETKEDSIAYMTGQMLLVGFKGTSLSNTGPLPGYISKGQVGGIIIYERNISSDSSEIRLKRLINQLQSNAPVPLFVAIDEEGGRVNRLKPKYGFPRSVSATYLGWLHNTDSTEFYATSIAKTLQSLGINVNFAPVADLCSNPNNPVIAKVKRCFSDDPDQVIQHIEIFLAAHSEHNVLSVLKHFPGHGSSSKDSHLGIVDVTNSWTPKELIPYYILPDNQNQVAVMTAHIINAQLDSDKLPATLSYKVNQKLLRDSIGFKGLLFSDDLQMKAISSQYSLEEVITLAVNSGVDVLMFSHNIAGTKDHSIDEIHKTFISLVTNGKISFQRIIESFQRIQRAKEKWQ